MFINPAPPRSNLPSNIYLMKKAFSMLETPKLDSFANRHKTQGDSIDAEAG